jgi:multisubunit Na+/H+ antiporter MnhF subunit
MNVHHGCRNSGADASACQPAEALVSTTHNSVAHALMRAAPALVPAPGGPGHGCVEKSLDAARTSACATSSRRNTQHRFCLGPSQLPMTKTNLIRAAIAGLALLIVNSGYLAALPRASVFYMANVVLHLALGLALMAVAAANVKRYPRPAGAFLLAGLPALYLVFYGNTRDHRFVLWLHIALAVVALPLIAAALTRGRRLLRGAFAAALLLVLVSLAFARFFPDPNAHIVNPSSPPLSMNQEGAGAGSPFAPASAQTNTGRIIPSNFFMDSKDCGRCHKDIYDQWKSSTHHFASFNNQFYRKAIEYFQDVAGARPSKWCAGCHDHAVFFNGRFDRPIKEQIDTPEAQAGLGCMSCHAIVHVAQQHGQQRFHSGVSAAARNRLQPQPISSGGGHIPHLPRIRSRTARPS